MTNTYSLDNYITESNYLEGRFATPDTAEIRAYERFLAESHVTMASLAALGNHIVPGVSPSGDLSQLVMMLRDLNLGLKMLNDEPGLSKEAQFRKTKQRAWLAYTAHRAFMEAQPFNAINGLLGRAVWLYCMDGRPNNTFLTEWYHQSLSYGGVAEVQRKVS